MPDKLAGVFTGLVQAVGRVGSIRDQPSGVRLCVGYDRWDRPDGLLTGGDSVSVSGVCLTVVEIDEDEQRVSFDVIPETLSRTTLGDLRPNSPVNLETAVTPLTAMGGHFVQGHVDGLGRVTRVIEEGQDRRLTIEPLGGEPSESKDAAGLMDAIVPKGSITVDGVSLTIAKAGARDFEVALIPTTLQETTLGQVKKGQRVNLETDLISKTVIHYLRRQGDHRVAPEGLSMDTLRRGGFIE